MVKKLKAIRPIRFKVHLSRQQQTLDTSFICFCNSSSDTPSFFTCKTFLAPFSSSEQLRVLESSFLMFLTRFYPSQGSEPPPWASSMRMRQGRVQTWWERFQIRKWWSKTTWFSSTWGQSQNPQKHAFCSGFRTEKHAPLMDFHAPGTGGISEHVQNTYFVRVQHVFNTYFRVRVMKWKNHINPFESRQKTKLTLFDSIELQAGTERFPIVEAFCFNALWNR